MKPLIRTALMTSLCLAALSAAAAAQPASDARTRVVVTFKTTADFAPFEREFASDARTQQASARHHRRDVVGAVMSLERRLAFRADAFFTRAVQGFSASLTRGQIQALAR